MQSLGNLKIIRTNMFIWRIIYIFSQNPSNVRSCLNLLMKWILFPILIFVLGISEAGMCCPICGCGGGNVYMGLLPDFKYQFIGLRFHTSQYHTQLINNPSQFSTNNYNTVELWGGVRLGKKIQLLAFVPYYLNKQVDDDGATYTHGLGDITVMGQYRIFSSSKHLSSHKLITQQLWIGGGIKLPTGPFNANVQDSNTTVADINAQIGTGSVDFLINGMYNLSIRNFGISLTANYKVNTANADQYKYGNKFQSNLIAFYRLAGRKATTTPNMGLGYENVAINQLGGKGVQYTGSRIMTAIAGVEFDFGKIGIGINGQIPLTQNFAEGQTKMKFSTMMHVTYQF
jgi:hypothetical protein